MLMPAHDIMSARPGGATSNRTIAIGAVGLLHVAAIYALVTGMAARIVQLMPPDLQVSWVDTTTPKTVVAPPQPKFADPAKVTSLTVPIPEVRIADTG